MKSVHISMKQFVLLALCGVAALALVQVQAEAAPINLTDGTSFAVYDPESVSGMSDWWVGGADHLVSQTFFVRRNDPVADGMEVPLSAVYLGSSGSGNTAAASFGIAGSYLIDISYTLTELSSTSAQVLENITIQNDSGAALDLSFFQYNNFDLAANLSGDYVRILDNGSTYSVAQQVEPGVSGLEEATVQVNPGSVRAEAAFFDTILSKMVDGDVDDLNNSTGLMGPGNMEFAFQWNYTLAPGATETISKVKTLDVSFVPEPASFMLALLGFGAIMLSRRRGSR